ncbi:MAG: cytochrome c family protein [Deltaproteobacteria bacterium]|nr:cytochrome c family protein [Deltaproteobacteria bacterium]
MKRHGADCGGRPQDGRGSLRKTWWWTAALVAVAALALPLRAQNLGGGYVGSEACSECHENQYKAFMERSRKSRSYEAIEKMKDGLTLEELQGCYGCHTTGYGKETGFVNPEETPHLKNVGCESCHGPGRLHTKTMEMAHIVKTATIDVCERCHDSEKVKSFRYKGVIYAGAH